MIIIPNRVINPLYECTNTIIAKATLPLPAAKILRIHQNKNRGEQILNLLKIHKIKIIIRLGWICPMIGRMLDLSMLGQVRPYLIRRNYRCVRLAVANGRS